MLAHRIGASAAGLGALDFAQAGAELNDHFFTLAADRGEAAIG